MPIMTLEPLRWQEDPTRITVCGDYSQPEVYYQVTSPKRMEAICCGRPAEELPRILSMLAPAHHLTAALALDRLFEVDPPDLAQNMRSALLQAQYCSAHLRKIYFLMTSLYNPFADFHVTGRSAAQPPIPRHLLSDIAHHEDLAQEAEDILGGRHDLPLTAVAGGVSAFLKEGYYQRLTDICDALLSFTQHLAGLIRTQILSGDPSFFSCANLEIPKLAGLHLNANDQPVLNVPQGNAPRTLQADRMSDVIALQQEAWTYQPFAYLKQEDWQGVAHCPSLFYVGPLARFNAAQKATTPLAEQERQLVIASVGEPPVYKWTAVFGAIAVELIQAVEVLQDLSRPEKLGGPALRNIPTGHIDSTWAVLDAPQGLTWHRYTTDGDGIIQALTVIDAASANNALKCMLAKQVVATALEQKLDPAAIKETVALALLPF